MGSHVYNVVKAPMGATANVSVGMFGVKQRRRRPRHSAQGRSIQINVPGPRLREVDDFTLIQGSERPFRPLSPTGRPR
jgi:hypothetical protein